jgi:hypothetical protein
MALPAHVSEQRDTSICPDASSGNRCNAGASFSNEATILAYVRPELLDWERISWERGVRATIDAARRSPFSPPGRGVGGEGTG